jgi:phosphohistidine swiveling domain-containing protein
MQKEHSREYSLFRIDSWFNSMSVELEKIVGGVREAVAVYEGGDLVDIYYEPNGLKRLFSLVAKKCLNQPDVVKKEINNFLKLFAKLKPYYIGQKKIQNIQELKRVYKLYSKMWMYTAIVFLVPTLPVDKNLKKLAYKARQETQEYNEAVEKIFKEFIENKYPILKGKSRFVLPQEIWENKISDTMVQKTIKERSKGYISYKNKLYTGNKDKILNKLNIVLGSGKEIENVKIIKGQIAQKGKVKGVVKLVSKEKDIEKVKKGDILVASMTMPRYLPAMKRASAFVTDEGGITCHAAIVSRELKKPCIIGTKIATQVLKDGMEVEVDADKGIIKIIK